MKEIKLKSGSKAVIKDGKGKDLFWAYQQANDPSEILKLLMVRLVEIDSKPITEETLEEMDIQDVMKLMQEVTGLLGPLQERKRS